MNRLQQFLADRLEEDASIIEHVRVTRTELGVDEPHGVTSLTWVNYPTHGHPALLINVERATREVTAKHRLLLLHKPVPDQMYDPSGALIPAGRLCSTCRDIDGYFQPWPCPHVLAVASVYSHHLDHARAVAEPT